MSISAHAAIHLILINDVSAELRSRSQLLPASNRLAFNSKVCSYGMLTCLFAMQGVARKRCTHGTHTSTHTVPCKTCSGRQLGPSAALTVAACFRERHVHACTTYTSFVTREVNVAYCSCQRQMPGTSAQRLVVGRTPRQQYWTVCHLACHHNQPVVQGHEDFQPTHGTRGSCAVGPRLLCSDTGRQHAPANA